MQKSRLGDRDAALTDFLNAATAAGPDSRAIAILETTDNVQVWVKASELGEGGLAGLLREYADGLDGQVERELIDPAPWPGEDTPLCDVCGGDTDGGVQDELEGVDKELDLQLGAAAVAAIERGVSHQVAMSTVARGLLMMAGPEADRVEVSHTNGGFTVAVCSPKGAKSIN